MTEIAERTGVAQSLVAEAVAQLHDGGVVETATDETNRPRTRSAIRILGLDRRCTMVQRPSSSLGVTPAAWAALLRVGKVGFEPAASAPRTLLSWILANCYGRKPQFNGIDTYICGPPPTEASAR